MFWIRSKDEKEKSERGRKRRGEIHPQFMRSIFRKQGKGEKVKGISLGEKEVIGFVGKTKSNREKGNMHRNAMWSIEGVD